MEYDNYANKKVKELVDLYQETKNRNKSKIPSLKRRTLSDSDIKKTRVLYNNFEFN